jgi:hypothetical protein
LTSTNDNASVIAASGDIEPADIVYIPVSTCRYVGPEFSSLESQASLDRISRAVAEARETMQLLAFVAESTSTSPPLQIVVEVDHPCIEPLQEPEPHPMMSGSLECTVTGDTMRRNSPSECVDIAPPESVQKFKEPTDGRPTFSKGQPQAVIGATNKSPVHNVTIGNLTNSNISTKPAIVSTVEKVKRTTTDKTRSSRQKYVLDSVHPSLVLAPPPPLSKQRSKKSTELLMSRRAEVYRKDTQQSVVKPGNRRSSTSLSYKLEISVSTALRIVKLVAVSISIVCFALTATLSTILIIDGINLSSSKNDVGFDVDLPTLATFQSWTDSRLDGRYHNTNMDNSNGVESLTSKSASVTSSIRESYTAKFIFFYLSMALPRTMMVGDQGLIGTMASAPMTVASIRLFFPLLPEIEQPVMENLAASETAVMRVGDQAGLHTTLRLSSLVLEQDGSLRIYHVRRFNLDLDIFRSISVLLCFD